MSPLSPPVIVFIGDQKKIYHYRLSSWSSSPQEPSEVANIIVIVLKD